MFDDLSCFSGYCVSLAETRFVNREKTLGTMSKLLKWPLQ